MPKSWKNWAGTNSCTPENINFPNSISDLQAAIAQTNEQKKTLKIVGHGDSYNTIFHTKHQLISLANMSAILDIDTQRETITFEAGATIPDLIHAAADKGLGFSSLGTSMFDTCAGACFTGHHGSGINYGILSDSIESFELLTGTGKYLTIKRGDWLYNALGVNLGAAGIVTKMTLKLEPRFKLCQEGRLMPFNACESRFDELLKNNDHMKFIWAPHTNDVQCWTANRSDAALSSRGARLKSIYWNGMALNNLVHGGLLYAAKIIPGFIKPLNRWLSRQFLHPPARQVAWAEDLFYLPHLLRQDAVEYAIPMNQTWAFLNDLKALIETQFHVQFPIEIRFVKADSFWLSPAYKQDMCYVGTKSHLLPGVRFDYEPYFRAVNSLAERYKGRPHWAKQFYSSPEYLNTVYEKWQEFWTLCSLLDPQGIFRNSWLDNLAYPVSAQDQKGFRATYNCNAL